MFSWSLRTLTPGAGRLFALLGLHPGPDLSAPAAASLAGESPDRLRPLLTELTGAHLLTEHVPGRYTFHDLLRMYAAEQTSTVDSADAVHRMYDHYLHSAVNAARAYSPQREQIAPARARPGVTPENADDHDGALAWFNAERRILVSLIGRAEPRWDSHAWRLTWALGPYTDRQGHWDDNLAMLGAAMAAAQRLDDRAAQAYLYRSLGVVSARLGKLDKVRQHNRQAIELFATIGDVVGEAHTWMGMTWLSRQTNDHAQAGRDTRRALELYRAVGHRVGEARALANLGWFHAERGEYEQAIDRCRQALAVHQETGDREGEASAWDSLGYTYQRSGHGPGAVDSYRHAAGLRRIIGDRYGEAETLNRLGDTHHTGGDTGAARSVWREALAVLDKLGHTDAEAVRAKLAAL